MIVFIDTSALIALLDEDDEHHAEAVATFKSLEEGNVDLVTTNYVEVETLAVARRRLGRDAAQRLISSIFPIVRTVWVDQGTHEAALASYQRSGISLVDQVSFVVMRREGIEQAFAFDADFTLEGFTAPSAQPQTARSQVHETLVSYGTPAADLVSVAEIAERAGRPINTVQSWRRRHSDFPAPVARLAAGPVWSWPSIAEWIRARPPRRAAKADAVIRATAGILADYPDWPEWQQDVRGRTVGR